MDFLDNPTEMLALASSFLLLLPCNNRALEVASSDGGDDHHVFNQQQLWGRAEASVVNFNAASQASLHSYQLLSSVRILEDDLDFWVKPRSTTWFSKFLLDQYDEARWLKMFRLSKPSIFSLADLLSPLIVKRDTKYRLAIPVVVRLACTLFKLTHGASLLICNEMFAVGRSSVSVILREVVHSINTVLRSEISWPRGQRLFETELQYQQLCGLPGVVGSLDATHIGISKPAFGPADYFYFKSGSYTMTCQAVVDNKKRFLNLFVGMLGSTNDAHVLRRSCLYRKALDSTLWDAGVSFQGFSPYLLGDSGFPLMPWLMVPHRNQAHLAMAESLFNKKLKRGRCVVENAFALLKQLFRELLLKSDLDVTFVPDVVISYVILHNVLQRQSTADVELLLSVLRAEGYNENIDVDGTAIPDAAPVPREQFPQHGGIDKRSQLGLHLAQ